MILQCIIATSHFVQKTWRQQTVKKITMTADTCHILKNISCVTLTMAMSWPDAKIWCIFLAQREWTFLIFRKATCPSKFDSLSRHGMYTFLLCLHFWLTLGLLNYANVVVTYRLCRGRGSMICRPFENDKARGKASMEKLHACLLIERPTTETAVVGRWSGRPVRWLCGRHGSWHGTSFEPFP